MRHSGWLYVPPFRILWWNFWKIHRIKEFSWLSTAVEISFMDSRSITVCACLSLMALVTCQYSQVNSKKLSGNSVRKIVWNVSVLRSCQVARQSAPVQLLPAVKLELLWTSQHNWHVRSARLISYQSIICFPFWHRLIAVTMLHRWWISLPLSPLTPLSQFHPFYICGGCLPQQLNHSTASARSVAKLLYTTVVCNTLCVATIGLTA